MAAQTADPIQEFLEIFESAKEREVADATRVALATVDSSAHPTVRVVLLKQVDDRGFVFYTNLGSRKARHLDENPNAALCFYWPSIDEQIRVEGVVERVTDEEADAYFASRDRGSKVGAWASRQSRPLDSRRTLIGRYLKYQAKFAARQVPRPDFWGGYRLRPERIEFWHNQAHRLHDRLLYVRESDGWKVERLYP
ncbi:MAG: pyridoxamine 5'-phosphate oxidase [Thermoanaerobaculia bacterium]